MGGTFGGISRFPSMPIHVQFGEDVEGFQVRVLNEREIRAAAGIMFFFAFLSLLLILFRGEFLLAKLVIYLFFFDFLIRVLINPR